MSLKTAPDERSAEGKWITFEIAGRKPKTAVWNVLAKDGRIVLGQISWFGRWRGYAFFAAADLVFERTCLRDIADFIERANEEHRGGRKTNKDAAKKV
jgi:hypothetical protein